MQCIRIIFYLLEFIRGKSFDRLSQRYGSSLSLKKHKYVHSWYTILCNKIKQVKFNLWHRISSTSSCSRKSHHFIMFITIIVSARSFTKTIFSALPLRMYNEFEFERHHTHTHTLLHLIAPQYLLLKWVQKQLINRFVLCLGLCSVLYGGKVRVYSLSSKYQEQNVKTIIHGIYCVLM